MYWGTDTSDYVPEEAFEEALVRLERASQVWDGGVVLGFRLFGFRFAPCCDEEASCGDWGGD